MFFLQSSETVQRILSVASLNRSCNTLVWRRRGCCVLVYSRRMSSCNIMRVCNNMRGCVCNIRRGCNIWRVCKIVRRSGYNNMRGCENLFANLPTLVGWTVSVDMTQMMIMLKPMMVMIDPTIKTVLMPNIFI